MTTGAPVIRAATADDIPAVHDLLVETWHDTYDATLGPAKVETITRQWHAPHILAQQIGRADWSFLVATIGGAVAGHAYGGLRAATRLHVARLYILPAHQRRGLGAALMTDLVRRHPTARGLELEVEAENAKGIAFYRREGFATMGETVDGGTRLFRLWKLLKP